MHWCPKMQLPPAGGKWCGSSGRAGATQGVLADPSANFPVINFVGRLFLQRVAFVLSAVLVERHFIARARHLAAYLQAAAVL